MSNMQQAIRALAEKAYNPSEPTAEEIKAIADKFDVELHALEGLYLDHIDRLADA